jgi:hypothetical protein
MEFRGRRLRGELSKRSFRVQPSSVLVGSIIAVRPGGVRPRGMRGSDTLLDGRAELTLHPFEALDLLPSRGNCHLCRFGQGDGFLASASQDGGGLILCTEPDLAGVGACRKHRIRHILRAALLIRLPPLCLTQFGL